MEINVNQRRKKRSTIILTELNSLFFLRNAVTVVTSINMWLVAILSASITCAANILNDYFDYRSGADRANNLSTKPLVRGDVPAESALLLSATAFVITLFATSWLELRALRLLVSSAALNT